MKISAKHEIRHALWGNMPVERNGRIEGMFRSIVSNSVRERGKQAMAKPLVHMKNWEVYFYNNHYNLSGIADHHPRLGIHACVSRTSSLVDYSLDNDILTYETLNTVYKCPLKYMSMYPYSHVVPGYKKKLVHRMDKTDGILDRIISASAKLSFEMDKSNEERLKDDSIDYDNLDYSEDPFLAHIKELQRIGL